MNIPTRSLKDYILLLIKGMAMGAADVVPGVSGGTVAFITGIYDEFLYSLSQLNPKVLLVLKKEGIAAAWRRINGSFLLTLFSGIFISLLSFARLITWALDAYPILVWAFFFGLIIASIVYLGRQQKGWGIKQWSACLIGALMVYGTTIIAPAQLPGYWWVMFIGGFIAICAMILPGVSGSFLLLLMGLYPVFLAALSEFNIIALASFGAGCVCGLLAFSRVLSWLLEHHHGTTLATLIGFLIGSLSVTWPWKHALETIINRHGEIVPLLQENVLPSNYTKLTELDPMTGLSLVFLGLGVFLVLSTELMSVLFKKNSK